MAMAIDDANFGRLLVGSLFLNSLTHISSTFSLVCFLAVHLPFDAVNMLPFLYEFDFCVSVCVHVCVRVRV